MEGINFNKIMDDLGVRRCEVADQIGVSDTGLWRWCRKAAAGKLPPEKVALIHATIRNIVETKNN